MKLLLLFIILIVSTWPLKGQIADFDSEAIEQDFVYNLNVYSQAFVRPVISTYSSTQLAIQQTSGKTLAPWAFSIAVSSSLTFVDKSNIKFNFNALPFSDNIRLKNPNNPILPSALGGSTNQEFIYKVEGQSNLPFPFNGPVEYEQNLSTLNGVVTRWDAIPTAAMMTNLGLPYNTEVFIRFVPNLNLVGVKNYLIGGGIKHMVSPYLWSEEKPLYLSISGFYGQSKFNYDPKLFLEGNDQQIVFIDRTYSIESEFSYQKDSYSFFGLLGFFSGESNFLLNGTYNYNAERQDAPPPAPPTVQEAFSVTDPIKITSINKGIHFAIGATTNWKGILEFSLAYHYANINTISSSVRIYINQKK